MTAHRLKVARDSRRVNLTANAGMGGATVGAGNHYSSRKEDYASPIPRNLQAVSWRAALVGWLPWVLVAVFAAVGGSGTALLLIVGLGVRP